MYILNVIKPTFSFKFRRVKKQKFSHTEELAFKNDVENYLKHNEVTKLPAKYATGSLETLFDKTGNFSNPTSMKVSPY